MRVIKSKKDLQGCVDSYIVMYSRSYNHHSINLLAENLKDCDDYFLLRTKTSLMRNNTNSLLFNDLLTNKLYIWDELRILDLYLLDEDEVLSYVLMQTI